MAEKNETLLNKLTIPLITILFSGIVGSGVAFLFNNLEWKSRNEFEQRKSAQEFKRHEVKRIMKLCQQRHHLSQLIFRYAKSHKFEAAIEANEEYQIVKTEWNQDIYINQLILNKYFAENPQIAATFYQENFLSLGEQKIVHAEFYELNREIFKTVTAIKQGDIPSNLETFEEKLKKSDKVIKHFFELLISEY